MGKCKIFRWFVGVVDGKGNIASDGRGDVVAWKIDKPQIGVEVMPTRKDGSSGVYDCYRGVGEDCLASGVTELADGKEGSVAERWEEVCVAC